MTKGRHTKVPHWVAYLAALLALACQEPTQITLEVTTDAACEEVQDTSIAAGRPSAVEKQQPATVTDACSTGSGRIGSLVLVPKDDDGATVGVRVVTGIGKSAAKCQDDGYVRVSGEPEGTGCIVARREVSYVASTPLRLPVEMSLDCLNIPCEANRTCFRGSCVSPAAACSGGRCDLDAVLRDAGASDADASEAGGGKTDASEESGVPEGGGGDGEAGPREGGDGGADGAPDVSVPVCAPVGARIATWNVAGRTPAPVLDPCVLRYSVSVGLLESEVAITIGTDDPLASIRVNGRPMLSGGTSEPVSVGVEPTEVTVQVTSVGSETARYLLTISRSAGVTQRGFFPPAFAREHESGKAVAISGDTLAFAADSQWLGVDGGQPSESTKDGGHVYVYVRSGDGWVQQAVLRPDNEDTNDDFGESMALDGDVLVVGAPLEDGAGRGPGADPLDNAAPFAGAAYVFRRTGADWVQEAYLKASDAAANAQFGSSVALSGNTLLVGAPGANRAYVFQRGGGEWVEQVRLLPSRTSAEYFGVSTAISGDTIAVGDMGDVEPLVSDSGIAGSSGAAYVLVRSGAGWQEQAYLRAPEHLVRSVFNGWFGRSVALVGDVLAVGAPLEPWWPSTVDAGIGGALPPEAVVGAAYLFRRESLLWRQEAHLRPAEPSAAFGLALVLGEDTLAVGAQAVATGSTDAGLLGANTAGGVFLFGRSTSEGWSRRDLLRAATPVMDDAFGVSLAAAEGALVVGAPGASQQWRPWFPARSAPGAVYIYE